MRAHKRACPTHCTHVRYCAALREQSVRVAAELDALTLGTVGGASLDSRTDAALEQVTR